MIVPNALSFRRIITEEIMDRPDIDPAAHREALEGLRRINQASKAARHMLKPIKALAHRNNLRRLSMLDIACGGGDVPIEIATGIRPFGIEIDLTLLDRSPTALDQATSAAARAGLSATPLQGDISHGLPAEKKFDVVTNSLFLHHLHTEDQVIALLRGMRQLAAKMIVVSDLRRCRRGYAAAWAGCRVLSRSKIVHHDGPVSVRAAWTRDELRGFAASAGMDDAPIYYCWPWRMLLVWQKP